MMDCRTASDLMMKYMDGEIDDDQQNILLDHLDTCECCFFEFNSIKDTMLMLGGVEMEEAPDDLEVKVISAIKNEERMRARLKNWLTGIFAFIVLTGCWAGLAAIILYTPVVNVLTYCFNMFINSAKYAGELILNAVYIAMSTISRLASVSRAFNEMLIDIRELYNVIIAFTILLVIISSEVYIYVQKRAGR